LASGGSGAGALSYFSRTPEICSISASGLVTGLKAGKCLVSARKAPSGIYANAISSAISIAVQEKPLLTLHDSNDPNHLIAHYELSYTELKNSTRVHVNLCEEGAGQVATLEIGSKSSTGKVTYKVVGTQVLDSKGTTTFTMHAILKNGQILRVKAEGKVQIAVAISGKHL
jgi:hypothetical protein